MHLSTSSSILLADVSASVHWILICFSPVSQKPFRVFDETGIPISKSKLTCSWNANMKQFIALNWTCWYALRNKFTCELTLTYRSFKPKSGGKILNLNPLLWKSRKSIKISGNAFGNISNHPFAFLVVPAQKKSTHKRRRHFFCVYFSSDNVNKQILAKTQRDTCKYS